MEIYHLDWKAANARDAEEFLGIIMPTIDREAQRDRAQKAFAEGLYRKVADLDTDSLNEAYGWTQNGEQGWAYNPPAEIRLFANDDQRSTSVGDVIVDHEGMHHVVVGMGFIEFTPAPGMLPA